MSGESAGEDRYASRGDVRAPIGSQSVTGAPVGTQPETRRAASEQMNINTSGSDTSDPVFPPNVWFQWIVVAIPCGVRTTRDAEKERSGMQEHRTAMRSGTKRNGDEHDGQSSLFFFESDDVQCHSLLDLSLPHRLACIIFIPNPFSFRLNPSRGSTSH